MTWVNTSEISSELSVRRQLAVTLLNVNEGYTVSCVNQSEASLTRELVSQYRQRQIFTQWEVATSAFFVNVADYILQTDTSALDVILSLA